jgi:LPXTG-site transpeptidase (sortase) family protein
MVYYLGVNNSRHTETKKPPFTVFLAATIVIFFLSLSSADSIDLVPNYIDGSSASAADSQSVALSSLPQLGLSGQGETAATDATTTVGFEPERLIIPAIGLDLAVQNPSTRDIDTLDALLQNGPARYVDSAKLGEAGNMIIFAHSSHLPIVHNKMFQAFNKIPDLKAGDSITLTAGGTAYMYSVVSVTKADVSDTSIDMSASKGTRLTLVTCDTLTGKSARYVLEADFVGTYTL